MHAFWISCMMKSFAIRKECEKVFDWTVFYFSEVAFWRSESVSSLLVLCLTTFCWEISGPSASLNPGESPHYVIGPHFWVCVHFKLCFNFGRNELDWRVCRPGQGTQRMTGLFGTVVGGSSWRLREVDRELAPPSHLLLFKSAKKQNLRQGGGDICRGINREAERQRLTRQSCPLPYRPPSGGGMLTTHFKRRRAWGEHEPPQRSYGHFISLKYGR